MSAKAPTSTLIDEHLLRLFDTLYATRSVSAAAALLGQAQPTVSIWLGQLRRELGDPLFVRTAEGMVPTPRADALIGTARSVIEGLRSLTDRQRPFDPAADDRNFRICMTDASHVTLSGQADIIGAAATQVANIDKAAGAGRFEQKFVLSRQFNAFAVRPGQTDFVAALNAFVADELQKGALNALYRKWTGTDLAELPATGNDALPIIMAPY